MSWNKRIQKCSEEKLQPPEIQKVDSVACALPSSVWKTLDGKPPLVIAHRGASGEFPEHTLEAYIRAVMMGANYIEQDVVMTKDGHLIVRHEPNLINTTDVSTRPEFASRKKLIEVDDVEEEGWFAFDFTLKEIKTLFAVQARRGRSKQYDGMFRIPTFDEVLQLSRRLETQYLNKVGIYVETKHPTFHKEMGYDLEQALVNLLQKHSLLYRQENPVIIQSFEPSSLQLITKLLPDNTTIKKVLLLDGASVNKDNGSVISYRPYDFVKSDFDHSTLKGDSRTFADLIATMDSLQEIKTYADGIGPWKPYIHSYLYKNKTGDGDVSNLANSVLLPYPTDLIERAHQVGLFVHPFTFRSEPDQLVSDYQNDPLKEYKHFYDLGVDGVFTDFADAAIKAQTVTSSV